MNDILFLIFNVILYRQHARLLLCSGMTRLSERLVFAFFLLMIQIMGSILFFGAVGWMYPVVVMSFNITLLLCSMLYTRRFPSVVSQGSVGGIWKDIEAPISNKLVLILCAAVTGWLFVSAYFLPPRGVDDICYHLPFIYDSIQHGRWVLLPTSLRIHFAYPMNAEALFAYPVLFLQDTRWVDAMQIPIGLWTAGVIYLFSRLFAVRRARAFFLAGIFFLAPIVIAQMGTNYIDLTCAGFLVCSLYLFIRFLNSSSAIYSYLAVLSISAMMGMKYHLLTFGLILAGVLLIVLIRKRRFIEALLGFIVVVALGLGWHLRNLIHFSDWIYPARMTAGCWKMQSHSMGTWLLAAAQKINMVFLRCVTNGTYDGGFGAIYGFIIFSVYLLLGWRFLLRRRRWIKGEILLWGAVIALLFVLVPVGNEEFPWIGPRMLLVVWPIVVIIFGRLIFVVNRSILLQRAWILCCLLGLFLDARFVIYSGKPQHHWWGRTGGSEFEAYRYSIWYEVRLVPMTSALDEMTQSLHRPATIFLASCEPFFSAPFYGRFLQTHIVNFDPGFRGDPDFLVYVTISPDPLV